jgi:hypothetical protein
LRISLLSLSLLATEIDAVKSAVNHQYTFIPSPLRTTKALDIVPKMVKAAARVARSSFNHVLKKACKKPKPGVDFWRIWEREVPVPSEVLARATVEGAMICEGTSSSQRWGAGSWIRREEVRLQNFPVGM